MFDLTTQKENPTQEQLAWYMQQYSEEDRAFFDTILRTLPLSPLGSLGPHSVGAIREVCELVKPKSILEIGFNVGYSATMWLTFTDADLVSVDNSDREPTKVAVERVQARWGSRFTYLNVGSESVAPLLEGRGFDLAFVDGDHTAPGVAWDLAMVRSLGVTNVVMDDYWPMFSAAQEVLPGSGYEVVRQWGNIVLCRLA